MHLVKGGMNPVFVAPGSEKSAESREPEENEEINTTHMSYPIPSMYGVFTYIWIHLVDFYGKCR